MSRYVKREPCTWALSPQPKAAGSGDYSVADALGAAASIARADDLQQAVVELAREGCRMTGAIGCVIEVRPPDSTPVVTRYGSRVPEVAETTNDPHQTTSLQLCHQQKTLGSVEFQWPESGPAGPVAFEDLGVFGELASAQVGLAIERESQHLRLQALADLATALREQTHEHSNHMQVLLGLHELGDITAAREFLAEMMDAHEQSAAVRLAQINDPVVAGTVVALTRAAHRRRIVFEVDHDSHLDVLPSTLRALDLVTVLANCVGNAFDAATHVSAKRRLVSLAVFQEPQQLVVRVRDWGPGLQGLDSSEVVRAGSTTKAGHHGMGLALVQAIVDDLSGQISFEEHPDGLCVNVVLPWR
jgi:anti-sigma regulatory factor (Ser/Thr protein kinase)